MNGKFLTLGLGAMLVLLMAAASNASASTSACAFPNENQCVCVSDATSFCYDTASQNDKCVVSYSYDQGYWWGYACLV